MDIDDYEDGQVLSSEEDDDEVVLETSTEDLTPLKMPEEVSKFASPGSGSIMSSFMDDDSTPFSDDFDYNILERPKTITREIRVAPSNSTTTTPLRNSSSSTSQNSNEEIHVSGSHLQQPPESILQDEEQSTIIIDDDFFSYNDEEFGIPQEGNHDSESKSGDVKRYKMDKSRPTVSAPDTRFSPSSSAPSTFNQMAGQLQKTRKVNNIWTDLVINDAVSEGLNVINNGIHTGQLADRGPESYFCNYRPASSELSLNNSRKRSCHSSGEKSTEIYAKIDDKGSYYSSGEHAGEINDDNNDPGYISESGLSLYSYNILKEKEEEEMTSPGYEELKCEKNTYWRNYESEIKSFKPKQLANYIIRKLNEPKSDIIHRSLELLGRDIVIKLFLKTMKIEKMGGMLVADRERQRTTGGIYFYLLQKYPGLDKVIVDKIFENDKQSAATKLKNKEKKKMLRMSKYLAAKAFNE